MEARTRARLNEYLFLAFAAAVAVAYGIVHDHITATISRPFFLFGKGLAEDPRPFRLAVTILAARATFWVGLIGGSVLLIANNHARLPYRTLARLMLLPVVAAALCAVAGGLVYRADLLSQRAIAEEIVGRRDATRFLVVWGIHWGSYIGGGIGIVAAGALVWRRRSVRH